MLSVHTRYRQRGGEDEVRDSEALMLRAAGIDLMVEDDSNDRLAGLGPWRAAGRTLWSSEAAARIGRRVRDGRIDLVHAHNLFPLLSPAVLRAAQAAGAAVVQTVHNYRHACVSAVLWRDGRVCEDCLGRSLAWAGVRHGCYRGSRAASAVVAASAGLHRLLGTWRHKVDAFIALTEFQRGRLVAAGLPAGRIHVKGNALASDPGPGTGDGGFALFVGRLTAEKGVPALLRAWNAAEAPDLPLRVVGDGPLAHEVRGDRIVGMGRLPGDEVLRLMGEAAFLVFPSEWYEGFPRVLVEAMARGTPVLAAALGAAAEIVEPGRTGRHFVAGDAADLARQAKILLAEAPRLRASSRATYEARWRPETNLRQLLAIYDIALRQAAARKNP